MPKLCSLLKSKPLSTLSKARFKSIKHANVFFLLANLSQINFFNVKMADIVDLALRNPNCRLGNKPFLSTCARNLL